MMTHPHEAKQPAEDDLVERLRDTARTFARDDPAPDAPKESYVEWKAADRIEADASRIRTLEAEKAELARERDEARQTSQRLNRRAQKAEADIAAGRDALTEQLSKNSGKYTYSKAFLWSWHRYRAVKAERDQLAARVTALEGALSQGELSINFVVRKGHQDEEWARGVEQTARQQPDHLFEHLLSILERDRALRTKEGQ